MSDKPMKPSDLIKGIQTITTEWQVRDLADFALPITLAMEAIVDAAKLANLLWDEGALTHEARTARNNATRELNAAIGILESLQTRLAHMSED